MRILHVINALSLGGAEALALRVVDGLQRRGIDNALCVLLTARRTHRLWQLPVTPIYLDFHGDYRRLWSWKHCVEHLARVIGEYQPDVVHSVNWLADVTAARACRLAKVPHVAYLVDRRNWLTSPSWKHRVRRLITRRAFARANTRCMAVSQAVADFVAAHLPLDPSRIDVVRNSIDVAAFSQVASANREVTRDSPVTIGMLSRLEEEKGHSLLLDAVEELIRRDVPFRVLIAGTGLLREQIEQRAAGPHLMGRVQVLGEIEDARQFYRQCDVFVVPSVSAEGLPTTILEAMASGCAVVATDIGGACEVIDSGRDGIIVPPADSVRMAESIEQLIRDPRLRTNLQQSARERAIRQFDSGRMIERICQLFSEAIEER